MRLVSVLALIYGIVVIGPVGAANPVVVMETNYGTIKIELFEEQAPITVKNFLSYVDDKFYDGLIFHRVIQDFMIQGGGFQPGMKEKKTKEMIKNEASNGLKNLRGTIAMARLGNDVGNTKAADTATAQFYINVVDNKDLDKAANNDGYCVFGRVTEGIDVVDKIKQVKVAPKVGNFDNVPVDDVIIKSVKRAAK